MVGATQAQGWDPNTGIWYGAPYSPCGNPCEDWENWGPDLVEPWPVVNPTFWGEVYVGDDGQGHHERPVWFQDWYTGAYYNNDSGEYYLCPQDEWDAWNTWDNCDDSQRTTVLAAWAAEGHEPLERILLS